MAGKIRQYFKDKKNDTQDFSGGNTVVKLLLIVLLIYLLVTTLLGMYWSSEPSSFSVREHTRTTANAMGKTAKSASRSKPNTRLLSLVKLDY